MTGPLTNETSTPFPLPRIIPKRPPVEKISSTKISPWRPISLPVIRKLYGGASAVPVPPNTTRRRKRVHYFLPTPSVQSSSMLIFTLRVRKSRARVLTKRVKNQVRVCGQSNLRLAHGRRTVGNRTLDLEGTCFIFLKDLRIKKSTAVKKYSLFFNFIQFQSFKL